MRVWRICSRRHAETAFSGLGSKRAGGRWTPPGHLAVYTAQHTSTAILEMLAHMEPAHFGVGFVLIAADLPDATTFENIAVADLPKDWRTLQDAPELQRIGLKWLKRGEHSALRVPSALVPSECNFILNPDHPDFAKIEIHPPEPLVFDPRLIR